MLTPARVGLIFLDWTDPNKIPWVSFQWYLQFGVWRFDDSDDHKNPGEDAIHVDLATDIVKALFKDDMDSMCFIG